MKPRKHECLDCGYIGTIEHKANPESYIFDYICAKCSSSSVYLYASEEEIKAYEQKVLCMDCGKHDFPTETMACTACKSSKVTPEETIMARVFLNSLNV